MIEEIKSLMAEVLNISLEEITNDASPENTNNWDSIRHMEILAKLEEKYSVKFDIDEMIEMMTLFSIAETLKKRLNG